MHARALMLMLPSVVFMCLFPVFLVHATSVALPYTFTAGGPISASQMMGNFASITSALSSTVSSPWVPSSSNIYFNTGSVGIGSSAPTRALDVTGSMNVSGTMTANGGLYVNDGMCVRQYVIGYGYVSIDSNNRTVLLTDNNVSLSSIIQKAMFANVLINGGYIGVDKIAKYIDGSYTSISASEFSVIYGAFDGTNTKSITINFRKNGSNIDVYQSAAAYWGSSQYMYSSIGMNIGTAGSGGYGMPGINLIVRHYHI